MGLIYKLTSSHNPKVYVSRTIQSPNKRFSQHKNTYKRWVNGKHDYISSFELMKHEDCIMTIIETNIPDDILLEREAWWHGQFDCVNNLQNINYCNLVKPCNITG